MQLTKLEKAIAISTLIHSVGVDDIEEYVDVEKLPTLIEVIEGFHNNLTPGAKRSRYKFNEQTNRRSIKK